jgi:hypothetical protein
MRKVKMGLITLAASAAVFAPVAGSATASTQSAPSKASAGCIGIGVLNCFQILNDNNVVVVDDVNVSTGGILCGVAVIELNLLQIGDFTDCSNNSHSDYKKIKRKW